MGGGGGGVVGFFFFKQKTAYEIYQCDWSSDVCSSDLVFTLSFSRLLISQLTTLKDSDEKWIRARTSLVLSELKIAENLNC